MKDLGIANVYFSNDTGLHEVNQTLRIQKTEPEMRKPISGRSARITASQIEKGAIRLLKVSALISLTVICVTAASLGLIKVFNYTKETQLKANTVDRQIKNQRPVIVPSRPKVVVVTNYIYTPAEVSIEDYLEDSRAIKQHRKGVVYTSEQLADFDNYLRDRGIDPEIPPKDKDSFPRKPLTHKEKLRQLYREGKINYYMP